LSDIFHAVYWVISLSWVTHTMKTCNLCPNLHYIHNNGHGCRQKDQVYGAFGCIMLQKRQTPCAFKCWECLAPQVSSCQKHLSAIDREIPYVFCTTFHHHYWSGTRLSLQHTNYIFLLFISTEITYIYIYFELHPQYIWTRSKYQNRIHIFIQSNKRREA